jgi:hypothetical protein
LTLLGEAFALASLFASAAERGKEQSGQDGYDRNHDEQFDEGEARMAHPYFQWLASFRIQGVELSHILRSSPAISL